MIESEFLNNRRIQTKLNNYLFPVLYRIIAKRLVKVKNSWYLGRNLLWNQGEVSMSDLESLIH